MTTNKTSEELDKELTSRFFTSNSSGREIYRFCDPVELDNLIEWINANYVSLHEVKEKYIEKKKVEEIIEETFIQGMETSEEARAILAANKDLSLDEYRTLVSVKIKDLKHNLLGKGDDDK